MTAIIEKLFHHVSEKNFYPYLDVTEYNHYAHTEDDVETSLRQLLSPDQIKLLEDLDHSRNYGSSILQEAAFQSGLAIGLELSRL